MNTEKVDVTHLINKDNSVKNADAIRLLAGLDPLDYDAVREGEAKKLKVRVGVLDKEVAKARKVNNEDNDPFPDIEPSYEPVNPVQLLDEISVTIQRFIVLDKYQANIAALWVAACWFVKDIHTAPIALINAPEKGCGKTQLLTVLSKLAPRATQLSGISPSVLFRMIEKYQPTLFIDEIETVLKDNEDLRGLFNAGHTRDSAVVWRSVATGDDYEPKRFSVWGMKAITGINAVKLAETVTSRSIIFELRRKKLNEKVIRLRHAEHGLFDTLQAKLARFAADYSGQVRKSQPKLPEELGDREQDNIEPLLQVATAAGGHWPDTAIKAALRICRATQNARSVGTELLADIQEIFKTKRATKISTAELIEALISNDEKPWKTYKQGAQLTPRQLSDKLKPYDIYSKDLRFKNNSKLKGYMLNQFQETFDRYLTAPFTPLFNAATRQTNKDGGLSVADSAADRSVIRGAAANGGKVTVTPTVAPAELSQKVNDSPVIKPQDSNNSLIQANPTYPEERFGGVDTYSEDEVIKQCAIDEYIRASRGE